MSRRRRKLGEIQIIEGKRTPRSEGYGSVMDTVKRVPWWGWFGLFGGAALVYYYFSDSKELQNVTNIDVQFPDIFADAIGSNGARYASIILQVADEKNVDPFIIAALGTRESAWSPNSGITGDGGHGRGLMQIDDRSNQVWLATNDWTDPYTNISKGVDILKGKISYLTSIGLGSVTLTAAQASARGVSPGDYPDPRPLSGDWLMRCAIAAYNTGEGNVLKSIAAGVNPDVTTTGGNYSTDVLAHVTRYASSYQSSVPA